MDTSITDNSQTQIGRFLSAMRMLQSAFSPMLDLTVSWEVDGDGVRFGQYFFYNLPISAVNEIVERVTAHPATIGITISFKIEKSTYKR